MAVSTVTTMGEVRNPLGNLSTASRQIKALGPLSQTRPKYGGSRRRPKNSYLIAWPLLGVGVAASAIPHRIIAVQTIEAPILLTMTRVESFSLRRLGGRVPERKHKANSSNRSHCGPAFGRRPPCQPIVMLLLPIDATTCSVRHYDFLSDVQPVAVSFAG
jgi:hypothetical protein